MLNDLGILHRIRFQDAALRDRSFAPRVTLPVRTQRFMVGVRGFEPPTTATPLRCATRLRYTPT